jgi:IMP dehydrogenase/GMP reductase
LADKYYQAYLADVAAASSAFVACAAQGELIGIRSVLAGGITAADAGITVEVNGTAVTGATLTITQAGSAAGDMDTADFKGYPVKDGDVIEFVNDGEADTTRVVMFTAIVREL